MMYSRSELAKIMNQSSEEVTVTLFAWVGEILAYGDSLDVKELQNDLSELVVNKHEHSNIVYSILSSIRTWVLQEKKQW